MDSDIGFHFNPRCQQGQIVMNNRVGGGWRNEERWDIPSIFYNDVFEVKLVSKANKYKVKISRINLRM